MLKGICMTAILLFHTEMYYAGRDVISYNLYVCDALIIFFFLSGYHFYKPEVFSENRSVRLGHLRNKLKKIVRYMLFPYFIFTALIAFPKAIAHGITTDSTDILLRIISGNASWFVAALIVAEIVFSIILYAYKGENLVLSISAIISFGISIYLSTTETSFCWQLENACMALSFLCLGYIFHEKEEFFNRFNGIYHTLFLLLILVIIKLYVEITEISLLMEPIIISSVPVFIINSFVSILFMVNVAKQLPRIKIIEWTGAHSLVYYFLCGGVPFVISAIFRTAGFEYNNQYYRIILAFIAVYIVTSGMTWIIYRYLPFMVLRQRKK